jgi:hypothetical protein
VSSKDIYFRQGYLRTPSFSILRGVVPMREPHKKAAIIKSETIASTVAGNLTMTTPLKPRALVMFGKPLLN